MLSRKERGCKERTCLQVAIGLEEGGMWLQVAIGLEEGGMWLQVACRVRKNLQDGVQVLVVYNDRKVP